MAHDDWRHHGWIGQEGAEKAHGAKLECKAEPLMGAAVLLDAGEVSIVEEEVAGQLRGGGVAGVVSVTRGLIITEKLDRHGVLLCCARVGAVRPRWAHVAPPTASV